MPLPWHGVVVGEGVVAPSPRVSWSQLATSGSGSIPSRPCARFAGLGCVWGTTLLALAGRTPSVFFDELWALDLLSLEWSRPNVTGQGPSPRVWLFGSYSREVVVHIIYSFFVL